ncbi:MAG: (Fe-S)-binding protein [Thermodesulfobacteriota bacterium]
MKESLCAKCGACTSVCPVYQVTGKETLTARGRIHLLEKLAAEKHSRDYQQIFSKCLLCNACRSSCPRQIDLPAMVIEARQSFPRLSGNGSFKGMLLKHCLEHQAILAGLGGLGKLSTPLHKLLPANSGLRLKLGLIDENSPGAEVPPDPVEPDSPIDNPQLAIFPGCLARHLKPEITSGMISLLSSFGKERVTIPKEQVCCGMASHNGGDLEAAQDLARENISAFGDNDLPIVVPCASCLAQLKDYPAVLGEDDEWRSLAEKFAARVTDLSSFLAADNHLPPPRSAAKAPLKRVVYHTPCHLRYQDSAAAATGQLLKRRPDIELIELDNTPHCCGFGGLFNLAHPKLSDRIATDLITEIIAADPDIVVTDCSGCLIQLHLQLSARGSRIKAQHLVSLLTGPK